MSEEVKVNKANKSLSFINNGIAYSQLNIPDEILDLITNLQEENEILKKAVKEKVIATCNTCEWFGVCPHSYKEYDYKAQIDKAIKYCELNEEFIPRLRDVIDILRGDE